MAFIHGGDPNHWIQSWYWSSKLGPPFWSVIFVWETLFSKKTVFSGQISSRPKSQTEKVSPNGSGLVKGNDPAISGKSELVKYCNLTRSFRQANPANVNPTDFNEKHPQNLVGIIFHHSKIPTHEKAKNLLRNRFNLTAKEGDFGYDTGEVLFDQISFLTPEVSASTRRMANVGVVGRWFPVVKQMGFCNGGVVVQGVNTVCERSRKKQMLKTKQFRPSKRDFLKGNQEFSLWLLFWVPKQS